MRPTSSCRPPITFSLDRVAGKLADLVILDDNPLTVETDKILEIQVVETLKEGKPVYSQTRV